MLWREDPHHTAVVSVYESPPAGADGMCSRPLPGFLLGTVQASGYTGRGGGDPLVGTSSCELAFHPSLLRGPEVTPFARFVERPVAQPRAPRRGARASDGDRAMPVGGCGPMRRRASVAATCARIRPAHRPLSARGEAQRRTVAADW